MAMKIVQVVLLGMLVMLVAASAAWAGSYTETVTVLGTDAIYLAGRTDVTIPPLGQSHPTFFLLRHGYVRSDFLQETFPLSYPAKEGMEFSFSASGRVHYTNGYGNGGGYPSDGGPANGSNLYARGSISKYQGPSGALVGVFLDDSVPSSGPAPAHLNFHTNGIGTSFTTLAPQVGQVFFIGNGQTAYGATQTFIAPEGATRLFLGIPDGWGFRGWPGYYDDNDGHFVVEMDAYDPVIPAIIDIKPETLNLKSRGNYVTAYIELQDEYTAWDIIPETVSLCGVNEVQFDPCLPAVGPSNKGDYDGDGIPDLMVKFDRQELIPLLSVGEAELTVTGELIDSTGFEGADTVQTIRRGK